MKRIIPVIASILLSVSTFSQNSSLERFLSDSVLKHASVSLYIADAVTGEPVAEFNSTKSLNPGSVLKLVTTAAAFEILGPDYTFKTRIGYTGSLNKRNGKLTGDIVIIGGGDPCLGSVNFPEYYDDFINRENGYGRMQETITEPVSMVFRFLTTQVRFTSTLLLTLCIR
jgi:D-alanyl-D-alanine carboxypeptidase/D-alanyl-D-alanine-endopeptidase (penicillin-binding protein 4)